jgi:hypothetical protein
MNKWRDPPGTPAPASYTERFALWLWDRIGGFGSVKDAAFSKRLRAESEYWQRQRPL